MVCTCSKHGVTSPLGFTDKDRKPVGAAILVQEASPRKGHAGQRVFLLSWLIFQACFPFFEIPQGCVWDLSF